MPCILYQRFHCILMISTCTMIVYFSSRRSAYRHVGDCESQADRFQPKPLPLHHEKKVRSKNTNTLSTKLTQCHKTCKMVCTKVLYAQCVPKASDQHGWIVRKSFKVAYLLAVAGIVQFFETVTTEEAGALGRQFVLQRHPRRREDATHIAQPPLAKVHRKYFWIIRQPLAV